MTVPPPQKKKKGWFKRITKEAIPSLKSLDYIVKILPGHLHFL